MSKRPRHSKVLPASVVEQITSLGLESARAPKKPPAIIQGIATIIAGFLDGVVAKSIRIWLAEKPGRRMVVESTKDALEVKFYDGQGEAHPFPFDISKGFFE